MSPSPERHNYCDNDRLMALVEASTVLDPVCSMFGGDASILSVRMQDDEPPSPPRKKRKVTVTMELSVTEEEEQEEEEKSKEKQKQKPKEQQQKSQKLSPSSYSSSTSVSSLFSSNNKIPPTHAKLSKKHESSTTPESNDLPTSSHYTYPTFELNSPSVLNEDEFATRCCSHCKDSTPSQWRHHPTTGKDLCNACWVHFRSYGSLDKYVPKKMASNTNYKKRKTSDLENH